MKSYSLKSEHLVIDWVSFKFQELDSQTTMKIADYLFTLGFNSYQESAKLVEPIQKAILVNSNNEFQVLFVTNNLRWRGTLVHFSGSNASKLYSLVEAKQIDWTIFSSSVVSRFDIYYSRKIRRQEQSSVNEFFEDCHNKLKRTNNNVVLQKNSKGLLLKIGNRRTNQFARIYQKENHLRFELEMKGRFIQNYSKYFTNNDLETLESQLSKHFLSYFAKKLALNSVFVDWLVVKLRIMRQVQISTPYLNSHYICPSNDFQTIQGRRNFFNLLQFLVFIQGLDYTPDQLGSTSYRLCVFHVKDLLKHMDPNVASTNHYQLKKILLFLDELQKNSIIKSFSDKEYRSLVTIPELKVTKSTQTGWSVQVWVAEELFYYSYPFVLPHICKKKTMDEFEVQFKVIELFSSITIEKTFLIKEFLDSYPSVIRNSRITNIKREFIQWVKLLTESNIIENNYKIIQKGRYSSVKQLTIDNISEGFVIYEKIHI